MPSMRRRQDRPVFDQVAAPASFREGRPGRCWAVGLRDGHAVACRRRARQGHLTCAVHASLDEAAVGMAATLGMVRAAKRRRQATQAERAERRLKR